MSPTTQDHSLPVGDMIEEFRIVRVLGTGSFGVVYQGANTYLDETVAIKEFLPTELARRMPDGRIEPLSPATRQGFEWALQRFLQEAKTLWGLAHPAPHRNIVQVTRYRELNGSAYMFMEFEHGRPFSSILEARGALPFEELLGIVDPLLSGLARVHSGGILHRDIKPANVLIRSDGSPVLIDFGSARYVAKGGERSIFATFTPLYAALEQHQEAGEQGPWTDVYGLGTTLYRAATGLAPKSASQRLLSDPQPPASDVCRGRYPEAFLRAIDHACELDPGRRPQSVEEWREELLGASLVDSFAPTVVKPVAALRGVAAPGRSNDEQPRSGELSRASESLQSRPKDSSDASRRKRSLRRLGIVFGILFGLFVVGAGWYLLEHRLVGERFAEVNAALPAAPPDRSATAANYEHLATEHFLRNELERSIELVELGLGTTPDDARLLKLREYFAAQMLARQALEQAREVLSRDNFERGLALIDKGLQQVPGDPGLLELRSRAIEKRAAKRREQAAELARQARSRLRSGDLDASAELMEQGLRLVPDQKELLALRSSLREERERRAEIASAITQVHDLLGDDDLEAARDRLSQVLDLDPEHAKLAELATTLDERQKARDAQRLADVTTRAEAALERGDLQQSLELIDAASPEQRQTPALMTLRTQVVTALDQQRADQLFESAGESRSRGDLTNSLALIEQGLALVPDNSRLKALRRAVESERKQRDRVAKTLEKARALQKSGQLDQSLQRIDEGLRLEPENRELLELQKIVSREGEQRREERLQGLLEQAGELRDRGDYAQSQRLIDEGLRLAPGDASFESLARKVVAELKRANAVEQAVVDARSLRRRGALDESLKVIEHGLALAPEHADLLELKTAILREQRQRTERAVESLIKLATERERAGQLERAVTSLEQALKLSPEDERLLQLRDDLQRAIDTRDQLEEILASCESSVADSTSQVASLKQAGVCYQRALSLANDDQRALSGLADVTETLVVHAKQALSLGSEEDAYAAVAALALVQPDHPALETLRRDLDLLGRQLLPELVTINGGCFRMGSPRDEAGRESDEQAHEVCVDGFLLAKREVSVADFQRFVDATGYQTDAERGTGGQSGCWSFDRENGGEKWQYHPWAHWREPNKYQSQISDHPVSCVSWNDANAYIAWLSDETGRNYRLPTEAEWEYAARAGTQAAQYWLEQPQVDACRFASVADIENGWDEGFECGDGNEWVAAVSSLAANPWGLYDILGNLWEWTCSNYDQHYSGEEQHCAGQESPEPRVLRGGAWNSGPGAVRAAYRNRNYPEARYSFVGFRLAQDPDSATGKEVAASSSPSGGAAARADATSSGR